MIKSEKTFFILLLLLFLLSAGCCPAETEYVRPTLSDGLFRVDYITLTGQNLMTGELLDSTITSGTYVMPNALGPLDEWFVDEVVRFNFNDDQGEFLCGLESVDGEESWENSFPFEISLDLVTGTPRYLSVPYQNTLRIFYLAYWSEDDLILTNSGQWEDVGPQGPFTKYFIHFNRIGP